MPNRHTLFVEQGFPMIPIRAKHLLQPLWLGLSLLGNAVPASAEAAPPPAPEVTSPTGAVVRWIAMRDLQSAVDLKHALDDTARGVFRSGGGDLSFLTRGNTLLI